MKTKKVTEYSEDLQTKQDEITILTAQLLKAEEMKQKLKLMEMHPYAINQMATGEWYTYLPPAEEGGRRIYRRRKTKEEIEDLVIKYWADRQDVGPTVEDLFMEAIEEREGLVNKKATIDRHRATFNKHFNAVKSKPIKTVTAYDIERFIYDQFKAGGGMTSKAWGRLRTVIDMILVKGRKRGMTTIRLNDVLEDMEYKPAKLMKKPEDGVRQKAYTLEEMRKIVQFCKAHGGQLNLAVALLVYTGLRVGELCTLRPCDISDHSVTVAQALEHHKEGGRVVYGVQDTKTENGKREIVIPESGEWLLKAIKRLNPFGEYVFEKNGKPITDVSVRDKLKYICEKLNIPYRSPHKIRKSYATFLIDAGLTAKTIQSQMGHADISTTMRYYYQDLHDDDEKRTMINNVAAFSKFA